MTNLRLLVCGSRFFDNYNLMKTVLNGLPDRPEVVINGGMRGADALSSYWAYENKIDTICEGAKWGRFGSRAGPIRNKLMLFGHKPTLVVAFYDKPPSHSRGGTTHMVKIARDADIEVLEVKP